MKKAFFLLIGLLVWVVWPSHKALQFVQKEAQEAFQGASEKRQLREGIRKDLLIREGSDVYHALILSNHSELAYDQEVGAVVEHLSSLEGWMQERFFEDLEAGYKMQVVRRFAAEGGQLLYHKRLLLANQVSLDRYLVPGEMLTIPLQGGTLLMRGVAKSCELEFMRNLEFRAHGLRAEFFSTEGLGVSAKLPVESSVEVTL